MALSIAELCNPSKIDNEEQNTANRPFVSLPKDDSAKKLMRVLNIPELRDELMSHMPLQDILSFRSVCKEVHAYTKNHVVHPSNATMGQLSKTLVLNPNLCLNPTPSIDASGKRVFKLRTLIPDLSIALKLNSLNGVIVEVTYSGKSTPRNVLEDPRYKAEVARLGGHVLFSQTKPGLACLRVVCPFLVDDVHTNKNLITTTNITTCTLGELMLAIPALHDVESFHKVSPTMGVWQTKMPVVPALGIVRGFVYKRVN